MGRDGGGGQPTRSSSSGGAWVGSMRHEEKHSAAGINPARGMLKPLVDRQEGNSRSGTRECPGV
jgi:hypothetical protein